MHKTWLQAFALNLLLIAIAAKMRSLFASHVPLGYQDEAGFHYGVKPTRDNWPATW
jgi:hypothetical protein